MTRPTQPDTDRNKAGFDLFGLSAQDVMGPYRRPLQGLASVVVLACLVIATVQWTQERWMSGGLVLGFGAVLGINALALFRGRAIPIPIVIFFIFSAAGVVAEVLRVGVAGVLWAFPAVLMFHFMAPQRTANVMNGLLIAFTAVAFYLHQDIFLAVRSTVSLVITLLSVNVYSYLVKRQQQHALEQNDRMDLMVRATYAGTLEWVGHSNRLHYSDRFKQMLGYAPAHDLSRQDFFELLHPEDEGPLRKLFTSQLRQMEPGKVHRLQPADYRLRHVGGGYIWVHAEGIALAGKAGRVAKYTTAFVDMTARIEAEQSLREAIRVREEVERIARHDLKTPLTSIAATPGMLRALRTPSAQEEQLLKMIERGAVRVLSMVNLSLDMYRMEQGSYTLKPQPLDMARVVHSVLADLRGHAAAKSVRLRLEKPSTLVFALGEELLCYSIVANLAKNAVEAAADGSTVQLRLFHALANDVGGVGDVGGAGRVSLAIQNTGSIPASIHDIFFGKYTTTGKAGGTGLGAYSARLMARVQQGDVSMHSNEVDGTTLTLVLPACEGQPGETYLHGETGTGETALETVLVATDLPALTVLIVDDDAYNLLVASALFPTPPLVVHTAINGRAAVDAVCSLQPDVVLMDLEMPVLDGFEATQRIRALERSDPARKRATVVAFSAHDDETTRARCQASGFDLYLSKPSTRQALWALLQRLAPVLPGPAPVAAPGPMPSPAGLSPNAESALPLWVPQPELAHLLADFVHSRLGLVQTLRQALCAGNRGAVQSLAHQLVGSLALYGLVRASAVARTIEADAPDGPTDALARKIDELASAIQSAIEAAADAGTIPPPVT